MHGIFSRRAASLGRLEQEPEPSSLVAGGDAGELRIEAEPAVDLAKKRERHPTAFPPGRKAPSTSPPWYCADHRGDRDEIAVVGDPPRLVLNFLAGEEIGNGFGPSDRDLLFGRRGRGCGGHDRKAST